MKDRLLMAAVAGGAFLATLGIIAVRGNHSQPSVASVQAPPVQTAAMPLPPPAAPEPAARDPQPDDRDSAAALAAPTYDDQTAARDRAAAHSARSR
jgi:hypothetical protein